jgi:hypothetical protein
MPRLSAPAWLKSNVFAKFGEYVGPFVEVGSMTMAELKKPNLTLGDSFRDGDDFALGCIEGGGAAGGQQAKAEGGDQE